MHLLPHEIESLLLHAAGEISRQRLQQGVQLNIPEAIALICSAVQNAAREGKTFQECVSTGQSCLKSDDVLPGVAETLDEIFVEVSLLDAGTKLVCLRHPVPLGAGFLLSNIPSPTPTSMTSTLPTPTAAIAAGAAVAAGAAGAAVAAVAAVVVVCNFLPSISCPGCVDLSDWTDVPLFAARQRLTIEVQCQSDRPLHVGSHIDFSTVNKQLEFERNKARNLKLDIPSGHNVRFEPGETKTVDLVTFGGTFGGTGKARKELLGPESSIGTGFVMSASEYVSNYGPLKGMRIRLADSCLWVRIEKDLRDVFGDELVFGAGKVVRDRQGQYSGTSLPGTPGASPPGAPGASPPGAPGACQLFDIQDVVITNVTVIDAVLGIVKADVGIKDGRIRAIGKAGNPLVMDGMSCTDNEYQNVVGPETDIIAGEGLILTAGGLDTHVHFITPDVAEEAICSGVTTLIGGGCGPTTGTRATTCCCSVNSLHSMMRATDAMPLNIGLTCKGSTDKDSMKKLVDAGAVGIKIHEDWGAMPEIITAALDVADERDVQVTVHTDSLNEAGCVEDTLEAVGDRTCHFYHIEGAGGGHSPDLLRACCKANIIRSSTNPTIPFTYATLDEHLDMLLTCHNLNPNSESDIRVAQSRLRAETMSAECRLHHMGAIPIISSDCQAMGRAGEVIRRTWQLAHLNKISAEPADLGEDDNEVVLRYIAKYTANPAIAHGCFHAIGSVEVGKFADLVLWKPAFFGVKPEMVIKCGNIVRCAMGTGNASLPVAQPIRMKKMFDQNPKDSILFVSASALRTAAGPDDLFRKQIGAQKQLVAVANCRGIGAGNMVRNSLSPQVAVDPLRYHIRVKTQADDDWELISQKKPHNNPVLKSSSGTPVSYWPLQSLYFMA